MIPFDFEYYRPNSITEALQLYSKLYQEGKTPIYYNGGTEIITLGRLGNLSLKSVIDIKEIPECNVLGRYQRYVFLGSALTLTHVSDSNVFPLLSKTASRVADRTARNKITLGGNIAGEICYREAVLPFLLADSTLGIV
ncbi:xanthine dehydrogenase, partial [Bacillus thuringiensis]